MIFNEIYSAYYNTVAKIVNAVLDGDADEKTLNRIVAENAFGESVLTVLPSLKSEKWQIIKSDLTTPIKNSPSLPLTLVQKQWLKAITLDERFKLFGVEINGLDGIEPMFTPKDYIVYDKYSDGDPYCNEGYIKNFRIILSALRDKTVLDIKAANRKGDIISMTVLPTRLEYSEKDDKFRLISAGNRYGGVINLARITHCEKSKRKAYDFRPPLPPQKRSVTLKIIDERNALERVMLHFAHFEKQAERIGNRRYLIRINYDRDDETELVIRVLSFGPMIEVTSPQSFRSLIIERLKSQKSCELI